jgi:hypothetical protein
VSVSLGLCSRVQRRRWPRDNGRISRKAITFSVDRTTKDEGVVLLGDSSSSAGGFVGSKGWNLLTISQNGQCPSGGAWLGSKWLLIMSE